MEESRLVDSTEAARLLGVKPASLYAYVSRGVLRSHRREGSRTSWYDPAELRRLIAGRGRAQPAGLAVTVESALTSIEGSKLNYRGRDAVGLAGRAAFEEVCHLLWLDELRYVPFLAAPLTVAAVQRVEAAAGPEARTLDRLALAVTAAAIDDPLRFDLSVASVVHSGRALIAAIVDSRVGRRGPVAVLEVGGRRWPDSIAARLWRALAGDGGDGSVELLNAVLILFADHELAASTLAARVAASTRADPYAVVSAALGAFRGPLHGTVSAEVVSLFHEASTPAGPTGAVAQRLRRGQTIPGFGPSLYTLGDPRAEAVLARLGDGGVGAEQRHRMEVVREVQAVAGRRAAAAANADFGLAAVVFVHGWAPEAGELIFAVARTAGWIAHALEEYDSDPLRYRGRSVYVGRPSPPPDPTH